MNVYKKKFLILLLSSMMLCGLTLSTGVLAYSQNVERKLDRISRNIDKQQEKITKITEKRSRGSRNGTNGASSTKISKIRDKIDDLKEEAEEIKKKEGTKINRAVKAVEAKKVQSKDKILLLEKTKLKKSDEAKRKYLADVALKKSNDPTYKAEPFKFDSKSIDAQIKSQRDKIKEYENEISVIRGTNRNKNYK